MDEAEIASVKLAYAIASTGDDRHGPVRRGFRASNDNAPGAGECWCATRKAPKPERRLSFKERCMSKAAEFFASAWPGKIRRQRSVDISGGTK